ncbi:MAG: sigma-54 dependent transcriptional regulator [Pseudomonadota bacterium]|nr:sigma-54 dependent transcriptional regulator [Pseudomonadota bacterium]
MSPKILIADDDPVQRRFLKTLVHQFGYQAETVESGEAALAHLQASSAAPVDLVILDLVMPDLDGMAVLSRLRERGEKLPIIVQTSRGSVESAVPAMRMGAHDFLVKPVGPERLQVAIKNALTAARLAEEVSFLTRRAFGTLSFEDLTGDSVEMARAVRQGERAAKSAIPVLLEGEPGTGKEIFARAIHGASGRRGGAFVTFNCGAPPDDLEKVLFGCEKGAFHGAAEKTLGKCVEAHGGTLFFDRICELPIEAQGRLLRFLQEGEIHRAGAKRPVKADVRLIFAANRNLIEQVKRGCFRDDLFYRINVFPISISPLRARRDDIASLARRFCARFAAEEGKPVRGICAEALALLGAYAWPGNVRQLVNAIFRAVVLADGDELTVAEFPQIAARVEGFDVRIPAAPVPAAARPLREREFIRMEVRDPNVLALLDENGNARHLDRLEAEAIKFALVHYRGQMSAVARKLGIGRSTLYRKLKQYDLLKQHDLEPACEESAALAARA